MNAFNHGFMLGTGQVCVCTACGANRLEDVNGDSYMIWTLVLLVMCIRD